MSCSRCLGSGPKCSRACKPPPRDIEASTVMCGTGLGRVTWPLLTRLLSQIRGYSSSYRTCAYGRLQHPSKPPTQCTESQYHTTSHRWLLLIGDGDPRARRELPQWLRAHLLPCAGLRVQRKRPGVDSLSGGLFHWTPVPSQSIHLQPALSREDRLA